MGLNWLNVHLANVYKFLKTKFFNIWHLGGGWGFNLVLEISRILPLCDIMCSISIKEYCSTLIRHSRLDICFES